MTRGLIVGKFWPPHAGHHHLIRTAAVAVDHLVVVVGDAPTEDIPWQLRVAWLQEQHPAVEVARIEDQWGHDPIGWARVCVDTFGAFDTVFTSEDYGLRFAECLGAAAGRRCRHVSVDRERRAFPVSGTRVRADPLGDWTHLSAPVRAWYTRRVVIVGAESTGKTTLSRRMAEHLQAPWVAEYGRIWCEELVARGEDFMCHRWHTAEFDHIAAVQAAHEEAAARASAGWVVCDTDAFATALWHHHYLGTPHPTLLGWRAPSAWPRLYLLTATDVPFVQDGLRDGEHRRVEMTQRFVDALNSREDPWVVLSGSWEERFDHAVAAIHRYVSQ